MRPSIVKVLSLVVCSLVVIALVLVLGLYIGERNSIAQLSIQMNGTQAMLAFNRISSEKRLRYLLSNGCANIALAQVKVYEEQDMQLLAEYISGPLPSWTLRYISNGDPSLIAKLQKVKVNGNSTWTIPDCRK